MTDDAVTLEADPYHALNANDRDHLLAAALCAAKHDGVPSVTAVKQTVGRLRDDDEPAISTSMRVLDRLEAAGVAERADSDRDARVRGVRVTDEGYRMLARGAARLDAAATVGGDADG